MFADIEDNQNSTKIELKINDEEHRIFDIIIDAIIEHKDFNNGSEYDDYYLEEKEEKEEEKKE